ncbi:MAG: choice-of-anchor Q domain-containing protein [Dokdonella sp.]
MHDRIRAARRQSPGRAPVLPVCRRIGCLLALLGGASLAGTAQAATCYVAPAAAAGNYGASWATATTLQTALTNADCSEVWVAAGTYTPTADADRSISFDILSGVGVYGGFAGTESMRSQRDPAAHRTILSGDIDHNDSASGGIDASSADIQGANAFHVVSMHGTGGARIGASTVLDGFVITGGEANGSYPFNSGGGLYCDASLNPANQCDPTLNDLVFSGNFASAFGGALVNWAIYGGSASPTLSNVTFTGNAVSASGGTAHGGAVYDEGYGGISSPTFTNVTFSGNSANGNGGALYNDGYDGTSSPVLTNVTFNGNHASNGGAIFDNGTLNGISTPVLTNVILWGDEVVGGGTGAELDDESAHAVIQSSVVQGGCPQGSICVGAVVIADPQLGPLRENGGFVPTIGLGRTGSAVDSASDASCPASDARGVARPQGPHCDMGSVELAGLIFAYGFE